MGSGGSFISKNDFITLAEEYEDLKSKKVSDDDICSIFKEKYSVTKEGSGSGLDEDDDAVKRLERKKHTIMISLHVASMEKSARILKVVLKEQGYNVWICTDMVGGVDFRTEIVAAVNRCTVFIPLINNAWAKSGECSDEFSLAKRLHLTSHESGRTQRDQPRLPIFIPFAFSDLDWNAYPHIQLLAASTNFLVHDAINLETGNLQKRIGIFIIIIK